VILNQVGEVQRAGEASRACADDEDVGFELFAFDWHELSYPNRGRNRPVGFGLKVPFTAD
jgi:hypothetical protein